MHLFGDENRFVFIEKYTLEPLRKDGVGALNCRDVEGIESGITTGLPRLTLHPAVGDRSPPVEVTQH